MKVSILKETFKTFFKNFFSYFSLSLLYTTIVLLALLASYFFLPIIIIAIVFVFVPASFSLHYNVFQIRNGENFSVVNFFKAFGIYFTTGYRGGYNSIKNTIVSTLIFTGVSLGIAFPFMLTVVYSNEEVVKVILSNDQMSIEEA